MHIFILGHSNEPDGQLSAASESRISLAISILENFTPSNQPVFLIATGGFGDNFNNSAKPHHVWVEDEVKRRGHASMLKSGDTLQSAHTVEDAILIKDYCTRNDVGQFLVVTNEFHLQRSKLVFDAVFHPSPVDVVSAMNPEEIRNSHLLHERDAVQRLETQGGVYWEDKLYPLVS